MYLRTRPILGPCTPSSAACSARNDLTVATPRCCIDRHIEIIKAVAPKLDAAGIPWWIDYGMLLGYEKNGGFYWNDKDIDIGVLAEDREKVREIARQLTRSHRFVVYYKPLNLRKKWVYSDCVKVVNSFANKATLDITFWETTGEFLNRKVWASVDKYKGRETPVDWIFPLKRGEWEGVSVNIPAKSTELVEYRYGENWKNLPAVRVSGAPRDAHPDAPLAAPAPPSVYFGRPRAGCEVTDPEGLILKKFAATVPSDMSIVEIGAYRGRSMCWLADGSNSGNKAPVYSVDLWEEGSGYATGRNGKKINRPYAKPETREAYEALREQYGHGLVTPIRGRSATVAEVFDKPVGMLFIDGDHTYQGVSADLEAWLPKLESDGILAFHDMNAPGVLRAIREQLQGWEKQESTRLVAVYTRKGEDMRFADSKGGRAARRLVGKLDPKPVVVKAPVVVEDAPTKTKKSKGKKTAVK